MTPVCSKDGVRAPDFARMYAKQEYLTPGAPRLPVILSAMTSVSREDGVREGIRAACGWWVRWLVPDFVGILAKACFKPRRGASGGKGWSAPGARCFLGLQTK